MEEELQRFREVVGQHRAGHPRGAKPYGVEQREFALRYVAVRQQEGVSVERAARELGVSALTVKSWKRRSKGAMLERVKVVQASKPSRGLHKTMLSTAGSLDLVVHGPAALRVEGLSVQTLAQLWRQLS